MLSKGEGSTLPRDVQTPKDVGKTANPDRALLTLYEAKRCCAWMTVGLALFCRRMEILKRCALCKHIRLQCIELVVLRFSLALKDSARDRDGPPQLFLERRRRVACAILLTCPKAPHNRNGLISYKHAAVVAHQGK